MQMNNKVVTKMLSSVAAKRFKESHCAFEFLGQSRIEKG